MPMLRIAHNSLAVLYFRERFVQSRENAVPPDDVGQAMAVEVGLQLRLDVDEHQRDAATGQVLLELPQRPRGRIVHVRDRAGIDQEPAHGLGRPCDQRSRLRREVTRVGIEQRSPKR